ncbi:MAG: alanine racemase [Clostridiales bacterium]|nr:alanine racemase [Clostridiales bacterium]
MFNETRRAAWTEVSLRNIRANYLAIRALAPESEVIACIKADAYGHGIVKAAWEFVREGIEYLGVSTVDEAVALRAAGISTPIVMLSATPRGNMQDIIDLDLTPVITTLTDAELLSEAAVRNGAKKDIPFFVAIETGMGRLGFLPTPKAIDEIVALAGLPGLKMAGVHSHFATADEPSLAFAHAQIEAFSAFVTQLYEAGVIAGKRTMANSAAIMALPESHYEIVRPGIALYGLYPSDTMDKNVVELKPAMSVKANIVYVKKMPPGFSISYGRRFVTRRESIIATLPIGYGDGLPRLMSGKGRVLVRGQYAPIVGTINMDQCMADVTDIPGVSEYDEAVIMGEQAGHRIAAEEIADKSDTCVYEVVCRFGQRLPKKYI